MWHSSSWTGAAHITHLIRNTDLLKSTWELRWKPVCGSTEIELSRWLKSKSLLRSNPKVFLTRRQSYGKGQRGRRWISPSGGVWLSAALPCNSLQPFSESLFGLAVAVALANRIENCSVPVQIKWPNDLFVNHRKIAGLLPRIIYRGQEPTFMCVGIGLNVWNRVPHEGIALREVFRRSKCSTYRWSLEVLAAIERAARLLENPGLICKEGERMLWARKITKPGSDKIWDIEGLDLKGQLVVTRGIKKEIWNRW
ncbi:MULTISPECIES: biotin--[acetyl-CoA-carboxylase] ligase [unclassified Prochlorococcus]|uniref:biotin--[acetyl-CoA-carboxylase] ligase n=1 Tax=unclassified Prochlorococcus TaxID=2627481 RepID=UPI0005337F9A|nr:MULTISPECIES: biotin--[acetyl-CoA-carboxylase] ligase [unclassified Prochlorococcus]KGG16528.1 Biotin-protein ligase [Prochlorococcus sp. MIT 0602]KGG16996.1 Biotin-protein ligase [Prochlorococcus sp. MIT 0603]